MHSPTKLVIPIIIRDYNTYYCYVLIIIVPNTTRETSAILQYNVDGQLDEIIVRWSDQNKVFAFSVIRRLCNLTFYIHLQYIRTISERCIYQGPLNYVLGLEDTFDLDADHQQTIRSEDCPNGICSISFQATFEEDVDIVITFQTQSSRISQGEPSTIVIRQIGI